MPGVTLACEEEVLTAFFGMHRTLSEGSLASARFIQQGQQAASMRPSSAAGRAPDDVSSGSGRSLLAVVVFGMLAWAATEVARGHYYTPRSGFGFALGVVGTCMMLALLAYPLRKRVRWMQRWGAIKHWFRLHMVLGVVGPTLVLFHSTFHVRSPNAAVALASMVIVVASGIIGRFVYTKIHYGLYGSRATLEKAQAEFADRSEETRSRLHLVPPVEALLQAFTRHAMRSDRSLAVRILQFPILGLERKIVERRCEKALRRVMQAERHPEIRGGLPEARRLVALYLREVQRVAQFSAYERLFALWHVLHIPLIYILAASTIFHIVAVYMY